MKPRSVMIYGASGSTKTTQLYHMAKYIREVTGKKIRMIHSDPGGYAPFIDSGMITRGEVEVFDYSNRAFALSDYRRLSEGYWPRWVKDGKAYPNQVEGSAEYFKSEPVCKTTPKEWEGIGGYFNDSFSSVGEVLKTHCSNQEEGVGFKESWKYTEDNYTIIGLQQGHYALVQKEMYSRHTKGFNNLPIPWLIYTALVGKGEDKQNRETVYGPQIVGNAATPASPTWFMDCLHLSKETYTKDGKLYKPDDHGKDANGMVAWFQQHLDSGTQIPYLCKPRILPELYPKLLEYFPHGFVPLGFKNGLDIYFRVLDKLNAEFNQSLARGSDGS